jgi:competence CoiA-like predicted nuclease
MFAINDEGQRQLAQLGRQGRCPICAEHLTAKSGQIRIWHWVHEATADCDPWAEAESEWHLGWKKHVAPDHAEVVIEKSGGRHRADVLCPNGAVLELQADAITSDEIRAREDFYKHMAWLFRATWGDRLHYGKKGFWWKSGSIAQTFATKPVFWDFEEEGIIQEVKLALVDNIQFGRRVGDRIVGRSVKTYPRAKFAEFIATGRLT